MKKTISILLAICMLFALGACGAKAPDEPVSVTNKPASPVPWSPSPEPVPAAQSQDPADGDAAEISGIRAAEDYDEIYLLMREQPSYGGWGWRGGDMIFAEAEEAAVATNAAEAPKAADAPTATPVPAAGDDYSGTNVQVRGVDEGDIVKTDGRFIYALSGGNLRILAAADADTRELYSGEIGEDYYRDYQDENGAYKGVESRWRSARELYILGDRLAVVYDASAWSERSSEDGGWQYSESYRTEVELYDVRDVSAPKLLTTLGQDGSFVSSRMTGGSLYLISRYYVRDPDADEPQTFVPCLYRDGEPETMDCRCIWIPEHRSSNAYTVVSAYAVEDGTARGSVSLLGGSDTVYMNASDLFLAHSEYIDEESAPRTEAVYTVTEHRWKQQTTITRVALTEEGLSVEACGSVDGSLLNQFSMDVWNGHLRLVTTLDGYSYTTWEDKERGFINTVWPENDEERSSNALYVLDSSMNVVGSLTGLAETERVYSVRFDGDTGYFVTFRQVDPLFAVDLGDPTAPKLLSALKIPGFSEYLHVWSEGRLLGLGRDADPETGRTGSLKLSMFDTSDKTDVTEKHKLLLPGYWSEALYNHKAILVSPEKNVFAFPVENGYAVYGYDDAEGFSIRAELELKGENGWWYGSARGLYAGDYAYVVFETGVWVLDLETLEPVTTVEW